ncbi:hypothetical protein LJC58_05035 [Lachnospiraceae bacterium OttesenSCG-928-D06]|nr:hypothetical protein [Lachnospiraceae bacterium OttesenSCG-928-D06]
MTIVQTQAPPPLSADPGLMCKYQGIATDGLSFYCTALEKMEIHKLNQDYSLCKVYTVNRFYSSICYDNNENCFWTLSKDAKASIFKLDSTLREIRCIRVSFPECSEIALKGIACGTSKNHLVISTENFLITMNKNNTADYTISQKADSIKEPTLEPTLCPTPTPAQSHSDLIESIALMEASLAHILNAEGEKLQKVIACSNNFCELMKVNNSVCCTIKNVTELEKVLLDKLREANRIYK